MLKGKKYNRISEAAILFFIFYPFTKLSQVGQSRSNLTWLRSEDPPHQYPPDKYYRHLLVKQNLIATLNMTKLINGQMSPGQMLPGQMLL